MSNSKISAEKAIEMVNTALNSKGNFGQMVLAAAQSGLKEGVIDIEQLSEGRIPSTANNAIAQVCKTLELGLKARAKTEGNDIKEDSSSGLSESFKTERTVG
jgi:hypothetical protein